MHITKRYITAADTARLMRADLKAVFAGVKFSVRTRTYAGGASIDVNWGDGPNSAQVEAVTNRFQGADFDGMVDLKTYRDTTLNGEPVSFGACFVFTHRDVSDSVREAVAAREPNWADSVEAVFIDDHLRRAVARWSCVAAVGTPKHTVTIAAR